MEKKYDKDIPLAVHVKEMQKNVLTNREADLRDDVARCIISAAKDGYNYHTFDKFPHENLIKRGFTNDIYNKVYNELKQKGYKLDYSGEYLLVSWDV